jgi:hypothetical protein
MKPALWVWLALPVLTVLAQQHLLYGLDGGRVDPARPSGKILVLAFSSVDDPQAREELEVLGSLGERYSGRNVEVGWVSIDGRKVTDAQLAEFVKAGGYTGRVMRDPDGAVFRTLPSAGRRVLPTIVILDVNGAPAAHPMEGFDADADVAAILSETIDRLVVR